MAIRRPPTGPTPIRRTAPAAAPVEEEQTQLADSNPEPEEADSAEMLDELDPDAWQGQATGEDDALVFNLEDAEDTTFTTIPPAIYDLIVDEVEYGRSQRSNNLMLTIKMRIETGEFADRVLMFYIVLEGDGVGRAKTNLKIIKPDLDLTQFRPAQAENDLLGCRVRGQVKTRKYEGEMRSNITRLMPPRSDLGSIDDLA